MSSTRATFHALTTVSYTHLDVYKRQAIDSAVNKKYIGQVEAIDRVTVQPRVSGNIVATRFRAGKVVKKGDLLFEIEDTRYRAAVEEAIAKKAPLEAKLLYAKNSFERYNRLRCV